MIDKFKYDMNMIHVFKKVCELGISVEQGSAERAWIKAAYLFIEYYVLTVVQKETLAGESFKMFQFVKF